MPGPYTGYAPMAFLKNRCREWGKPARGRNMNGHSPAITRMPFDLQNRTASGFTAPAPDARYIHTLSTPAWAHSNATAPVTWGLVSNKKQSFSPASTVPSCFLLLTSPQVTGAVA